MGATKCLEEILNAKIEQRDNVITISVA